MAGLEHILILGLGSNDPKALNALKACIGHIQDEFQPESISKSKIYQNEAVGFESSQPFLNMAVSFKSALLPFDILAITENIERKMGRLQKSTNGYSSRIIDIDILFIGSIILSSQKLQIPHPRFNERDFVLQPLMDLHPNFIDPKSQLSIKQHVSCLKSNRKLVEKKF